MAWSSADIFWTNYIVEKQFKAHVQAAYTHTHLILSYIFNLHMYAGLTNTANDCNITGCIFKM